MVCYCEQAFLERRYINPDPWLWFLSESELFYEGENIPILEVGVHMSQEYGGLHLFVKLNLT